MSNHCEPGNRSVGAQNRNRGTDDTKTRTTEATGRTSLILRIQTIQSLLPLLVRTEFEKPRYLERLPSLSTIRGGWLANRKFDRSRIRPGKSAGAHRFAHTRISPGANGPQREMKTIRRPGAKGEGQRNPPIPCAIITLHRRILADRRQGCENSVQRRKHAQHHRNFPRRRLPQPACLGSPARHLLSAVVKHLLETLPGISRAATAFPVLLLTKTWKPPGTISRWQHVNRKCSSAFPVPIPNPVVPPRQTQISLLAFLPVKL